MRDPRHSGPTLAAVLLAAALLAPAPAPAATSGAFSVEVLVNGVPLTEYSARGTTYVEALAGREYSLRLSNRSGERVAVALAVDGLNSIDARTTAAWHAAKWVLGPWETVSIDGWQTSSRSARRFFFTTEERSYGAWLGRTADLGVITAVVYREQPPPPPPQPILGGEGRRRDTDANAAQEKAAPGAARGAPVPAPSDDLAATGIGRKVDNPVRRVHLQLDPRPRATVRIRYEYRPALVRLGVLPAPLPPDPLERREHARGFSDLEFAPDPWATRDP